MRRSTSSLPRKAARPYISGPCPSPTRQTRQAFQGLIPVCSTQGSTTAFCPSTLKSSMVASTSRNCCISAAVPSFQFFLTNLSSRLKAVGATKKKRQRGHRSLTKETLRLRGPSVVSYSMTFDFIIATTSAARSSEHSMPCSFRIFTKAGAHSASLRCRRYSRLNQNPLT